MILRIERETDRDGVRYYWSLLRRAEVLAESVRHFESADDAETDGRDEAAMHNVAVDTVEHATVSAAK